MQINWSLLPKLDWCWKPAINICILFSHSISYTNQQAVYYNMNWLRIILVFGELPFMFTILLGYYNVLGQFLQCFQVGYDKQGLPIGLQLIGRPWGEASLLRMASAIEVSYQSFYNCWMKENRWFLGHAVKIAYYWDLIYSSHVFQELCLKSKKRPASFYDVLKTN